MLTFFYTLSLSFIWIEWIQFKKKSLIYTKDFDTVDLTQLKLFLILKLTNVVCLFLGLFTPLWIYYFIINLLELTKFIPLFIKKFTLINVYNLLCSIIYVILYLIIFVRGVVL